MSKVNRPKYDDIDILMLRIENVESRLKLLENMIINNGQPSNKVQQNDPHHMLLQELLVSIKEMKNVCNKEEPAIVLDVVQQPQMVSNIDDSHQKMDAMKKRGLLTAL